MNRIEEMQQAYMFGFTDEYTDNVLATSQGEA